MKKLITLIFALTLLIGTATVYASSNASEKLSNWYKNAYNKSTNATIPVMVDGLLEIKDTAKKQSITLKDEAISKIESFYLTTNGQVLQNIENYNENYKTRLVDTQNTLEKANFGEFTENKKADLEVEITNDVELMLTEVLGE